jgi:hypothetical protein
MPPAALSRPLGLFGGGASSPRGHRKVFEISLVRPSMRALAAGRRGCAHCQRTPLVGETVFVYGERIVCELCRPLRREAPGREEIVHSVERGHTVKRSKR